MNDELMIPEELGAVTLTNDQVAEVVKSGDYLPRIQVMGASTGLVKEGKFPMGHFGLMTTKENGTDLGTEFDFLSIAFRPKAMRLGAEGVAPMVYHKRDNPEFEKIVKESAVKDSGCLFGAEFLIWIPSENQFANFFFNNPTLRQVAPDLIGLMKVSEEGGKTKYAPKPATAKINFIKKPKYSWHGAVIQACSTPLAMPPDYESWLEKVNEQLTLFKNPPDSKVETAEPAAGGRAQ